MASLSPLIASQKIPSIMLGLLVLTIPLFIWAEQNEFSTWTSRLVHPVFINEPNRHTPIHATGTFLPPTITSTLELTSAQNPVIVPTTTHISATGKLIINEGVLLVVHEYGQLVVEGTLETKGTSKHPILLTTNEAHTTNQVWGGIIFTPNSQGALAHTTIEYASPPLTCLSKQLISITDLIARYGQTSLYNPNQTCLEK